MRMGRTHHHLLKFHTLWHTAIRTPVPHTPTSQLHLVWWNSHDTSVVIRSVSKWFNRAKNLRKWITKNVKQNKAISNHDEWLHKVQKREFNMSNEWTGRLCFSVSVWKVRLYNFYYPPAGKNGKREDRYSSLLQNNSNTKVHSNAGQIIIG